MGTSLSGLTPATTFDGLLKVGDNDPLTADLKAISTGDGTDTILSLSTGALQIGGATTIVGVDNDYNTVGFEIQRSDSQYIFRARNRGAIQMGSGIDWIEMNSNNNGIRLKTSSVERARITEIGLGIGETTPTSRLHVKGSGATSATTSLLVQNSAGTDMLKVTDDGRIDLSSGNLYLNNYTFYNGAASLAIENDMIYRGFGSHRFTTYNGAGGYPEVMRITGNTSEPKVGIGETTPTARLHVKGSGNDNTTTSLLVQNSDATDLLKVSDDGVSNVWLPSSGLKMQRSSACRLEVRGVGAATNIDISPWSGSMSIGGANVNKVSVGSTTPLDSKFSIKGSGATSATTALLVQNSAGEDAFLVRDDKTSYLAGNLGVGRTVASARIHAMASNSNGTSKIFIGEALGGADRFAILDNGFTSIGHGAPTARLHVKGSGNDNTTTALLVQNSDGHNALKVSDDGRVKIENNHTNNKFVIGWPDGSESLIFNYTSIRTGGGNPLFINGTATHIGSNSGTRITAAATGTTIFGSGNDATTTALLVQNSDGDDKFKITDAGGTEVTTNETWKLTLQSNDLSQFLKLSHNNIYTTNALYLSGSSTILQGNGAPRVTAAATGTTIKGSGSTSATTALLVENSAGTDLFKVEDGGDVKIDNGVAADLKVSISPVADKYIELDRQSRQVRFYSGSSGNAGIFMAQADKFSIGTNNSSLILLDENSNVKIGSGLTSADTSAKLQVDSTTQGFLPPRMTDAERDAIATPAAGLMIYDTSNNQMNYWNGSTWIAF